MEIKFKITLEKAPEQKKEGFGSVRELSNFLDEKDFDCFSVKDLLFVDSSCDNMLVFIAKGDSEYSLYQTLSNPVYEDIAQIIDDEYDIEYDVFPEDFKEVVISKIVGIPA